ncbi:MAG: hypothetical protein KGJ13_12505 [Patescibacteria group bacterium]|nr:hypothetical protein [Patescibacteria group bacterium]
MEEQITDSQMWLEIDGTHGITWVPFDVLSKEEIEECESTDDFDQENLQSMFGDYYEGKVWSVTTRQGFGARLSAPGYLDCTEWTVFDSYCEAETFLEEMYGDDEEEQDE